MIKRNIYILSFAIGLFLIMGFVIAGELINRNSTTEIDNVNLLAIQRNLQNITGSKDLPEIKITISDGVCSSGKCKVCAYQKYVIDECFYIQQGNEELMRIVAEKMISDRLNRYGEKLIKKSGYEDTTKIIGGEITVNGK